MFTYIKLKNFKSFSNVTLDLQRKKDNPKNLCIIYGPNGSGKSSIVQAFMVLYRTMGTMKVKDMIMDLLENKIVPPDDIPIKPEKMLEILKSKLSTNTVESLIQETKMIDSLGNMILEYGFNINGNSGKYVMEFSDTEIVHERLEYKILKNRGCCFDITQESSKINSNIFNSDEYINDLKKQVEMYWGKHSLLSIFQHEMEEKSGSYVNSNYSQNIIDVLEAFSDISLKVKNSHDRDSSLISVDNEMLFSLESGIIDASEECKLDEIECVINEIYTSIFDDVNNVFYKRKEDKDKIIYRLFLNKQVEDHTFDIDFKYESSGTQELLEILPYLMLAKSGHCVVIDEFGNGIHELLAAKVFNGVAKDMLGQLIITTHNTMIMEEKDVTPDSFYYIVNTRSFNKSIQCITDIEDRLHPKYNYRNRYFTKEEYSDSLPKVESTLDFTKLANLYK